MSRVLATVLVALIVAVPASLTTVIVAADQLDLRGPRGQAGPRGDTGPPGRHGRRGPAGPSATGVSPDAGVNQDIGPDAGVNPPVTPTTDDIDELRTAACASMRSVANLEQSPTRQRAIVQAALRLGCTVTLDG